MSRNFLKPLVLGLALAVPAVSEAQGPIQVSLFTPIQIVPETEGVRGLPPGAGHERRVIEGKAVDVEDRAIAGGGIYRRRRRERPVGHESQGHTPRVERLHAVDGAEQVGVDEW